MNKQKIWRKKGFVESNNLRYAGLSFKIFFNFDAPVVLTGTSRVSYGAFLVAQLVTDLSAVQESWVQSLDWKDPLEKEMTTRFNILAWEIPWTQELSRLQYMRSQELDST